MPKPEMHAADGHDLADHGDPAQLDQLQHVLAVGLVVGRRSADQLAARVRLRLQRDGAAVRRSVVRSVDDRSSI